MLPEFHLTSWDTNHPGFRDACEASNAYLVKYQELARRLGINIVPGTICGPPEGNGEDEDQLHNMSYFIAAGTGDICGSYQKKNLWHPEREHITSSGHKPHQAFDTPFTSGGDGKAATAIRAGLLTCWDLAFPEAFRALVRDGAQLIIVPSFWFLSDVDEAGTKLNPESERLFLESATVTRAFENTACIVFCNAAGASCITLPHLGALGRLDFGVEGLLVKEVDMGVLAVAENNYKIRQDLQSADWHYGYKK